MQTSIPTLFAAKGASKLDLPMVDGKYQTATMLYADVERLNWQLTYFRPLTEGEIVDNGFDRKIRVTWATADQMAEAA